MQWLALIIFTQYYPTSPTVHLGPVEVRLVIKTCGVWLCCQSLLHWLESWQHHYHAAAPDQQKHLKKWKAGLLHVDDA